MRFLIEHSCEFFLVALGLGIILYCAGKFIPPPLKFISDMVKTLIKEFKNYKQNISIEKINVIMMILFFILSLLTGLCELGPSAFKQALGFDEAEHTNAQCFIACLIALLISTVVSPLWILIIKREQHLIKISREN